MARLWTSKVSISNCNIKCSVGKSIFAVNLPLKLFRAIVTNGDSGSLKSLHTLFDTCGIYLEHMLAKFKPNRIFQNVQKIWAFLTKNWVVLKPFLTKFQTSIFHVKPKCSTKHGRPDKYYTRSQLPECNVTVLWKYAVSCCFI